MSVSDALSDSADCPLPCPPPFKLVAGGCRVRARCCARDAGSATAGVVEPLASPRPLLGGTQQSLLSLPNLLQTMPVDCRSPRHVRERCTHAPLPADPHNTAAQHCVVLCALL